MHCSRASVPHFIYLPDCQLDSLLAFQLRMLRSTFISSLTTAFHPLFFYDAAGISSLPAETPDLPCTNINLSSAISPQILFSYALSHILFLFCFHHFHTTSGFYYLLSCLLGCQSKCYLNCISVYVTLCSCSLFCR